jgi:hypothetical protein
MLTGKPVSQDGPTIGNGVDERESDRTSLSDLLFQADPGLRPRPSKMQNPRCSVG